MSQFRRLNRLPLLLPSPIIQPTVILLILLALLVDKTNQQQQQLAPANPQAQYNNQFQRQLRSSSLNNLLVESQQQQQRDDERFAQSLPLIRQQPDLDNVIESTTSSAAKLVVASSATTPSTSCQLPPTWAGKWYQSNKEPIRVTNTEISDKGLCRDQKGDKYLFEYSASAAGKSQPPCLLCLVINERHLNVLQYKESSCQPIPANYYNRSMGIDGSTQTLSAADDQDHTLLDSICSDITGDAQLESLFRLETPAIECPINGQFAFTYDSCREPQSSLDSCIDKKQLNFKFTACPDVPGSESKSEVLRCYADWSEGNNYYMIGRLEHASNHQDKGKFRCFLYEKSPDGKFIQMAQSLEESCYGLINANEGPKTLRLTVKPPTYHKCHFPSYIQSQSENWLSVDNSLIYMFNQNSTKYQVKETKEGNVIEEATCLQQFTYPQVHAHPHSHQHQHLHQQARTNQAPQVATTTNRRYQTAMSSSIASQQVDQSLQSQQASKLASFNEVVYLVQITKNCQTTNYCVRFYKRSNGIVQIDYFNSSPGNDNQCRNAFIGTPQTQIITSTNLEHQRCPFEGAYTIEAPIESDLTYNPSNIFICPRLSYLTAQCDHPSRLRIHSKCSSAKFSVRNLYCLGSWTTNGLVRLLLADDDRQRYSAWYRDYAALQPTQDVAIAGDSPQALALQRQQLTSTGTTRSQQLLSASPNYMSNSLAPIVDLQLALITPLPIMAKPMQVRLTRRSQCSELRGYTNSGTLGGGSPTSASNFPSSLTASSSATSSLGGIYFLNSSMLMLLIVTMLANISMLQKSPPRYL